MQLNVASGAYADPVIDINNQLCINWFPAESGLNGRGSPDANTGNGSSPPKVLRQTAGVTSLLSTAGLVTRSQITVRGYTYQIIDNKVYKITIDVGILSASATLIGTIATSSGYVSVAYNTTQIMWVDGTGGYIYNDSTNTFADITDGDFPACSHVVFTGGYFVVNQLNSGIFWASALNDGFIWDPLDKATAETSPDNIIALAVAHEELWVIGEESVEIWFNEGNASGSPFSLRVGLALTIGCQAAGSVVIANGQLFFYDSRGYLVKAGVSNYMRENNTGYQLDIISEESLTNELKSYIHPEEAIGCVYLDRGHLMVQWSWPSDKKTWVYDTTTEQWHQHTYYDEFVGEHQHAIFQFTSTYYNLTLASGYRSGTLYILSDQSLDDDGVFIRRIRSLPFLYNRENVKLVTINQFALKLGLIDIPATGDYTDPLIGLRYSINGGHSWSTTQWRSIGGIGAYNKIITWNRLGTAYNWTFEILLSDPISLAITDAWLLTEVEP